MKQEAEENAKQANMEQLLKLRETGAGPKACSDAGYDRSEMKEVGFSAIQLKDAGFTASELKGARLLHPS
jgi:hypothetical protein